MKFCTSAAVITETVLDQYRTLIGNRIQQIERVSMAIPEVPEIALDNSALSIVSNGSHVALPQHLLSFLFHLADRFVYELGLKSTYRRVASASRRSSSP